MERSRFSGQRPKEPQQKEQIKDLAGQVAHTSWIIWAFILAAALNFGVAVVTGSLADIVACILIMVGLAGAIKGID